MRGADFALSGLEAFFELRIDYDRVDPVEDDLQWLICQCSCSVDMFAADFALTMARQDFERFHALLSPLSAGDVTEVELENLESDFRLQLTVRATGAVSVAGKLAPGYTRSRATLDFAFDSDLTTIDSAVRRLDTAIRTLKKAGVTLLPIPRRWPNEH